VGFHRYINFSLGLEPEPTPGRAGGEKQATDADYRTALAAAKRRFEGLKFDGFVIADIRDDLRKPGDRK